MAKRKIYRFHQLPKKAKEKASQAVAKAENYTSIDWDLDWENMRESLHYYLDEAKLEYEKVLVDDNYGISLDLSSVSMTDDYLKSILTPELLEKLRELESLFDGYVNHRLFDPNYDADGYELELDYYGEEIDHQEGMAFLLKYSDDEEKKAEFTILHILEAELDDETEETLYEYLKELGESIAKEFTGVINEKVKELVRKMEIDARNGIDYIGSPEYFYYRLDAEVHEEEIYRFNYKGEIIIKDDDFVKEEFEEIYMDSVA